MLYYKRGSQSDNLSALDIKDGLYAAFEKLGKRKKVLAIPPDMTRFHSRAGELTQMAQLVLPEEQEYTKATRGF